MAALLVGVGVEAAPMTADQAVAIALKQNPQVIQARANTLQARAGLYSSYSGVLPVLSASLSRSASRTDKSRGSQVFGTTVFNSSSDLSQSYQTNPTLSGSWNVLDLAGIANVRSAGKGLAAAQHGERSSRQDAVLSVRRQFYGVVQQIRLADVSDAALRLARDNERRVRALFEVGSVARNDLLRALVNTSQAVLDSLTSHQQVTVQRNALASLLGLPEAQLGEVDTTLAFAPRTYDENAILTEAGKSRPDILAAEAELAAARSGLRGANFQRLPYVTVSGTATFEPRSSSTVDSVTSSSRADRALNGRIALNLDLFSGMAIESQIASARARSVRAQESRDALRRNLAAEVHEAIIDYQAAIEGYRVASDAAASAEENLRLVQEKYNVGSATILDLIDAQVQQQRAASDRVRALAAIRIAEAQVDRVRGLGD